MASEPQRSPRKYPTTGGAFQLVNHTHVHNIENSLHQAKRFPIEKKLVEAKSQRTLDVMKWLDARYGGLSGVQADFDNESEHLEQCYGLPRPLMVEGRIADIYWRYLRQVLPAKFRFISRIHETHQMNAFDPVNVLLNSGIPARTATSQPRFGL